MKQFTLTLVLFYCFATSFAQTEDSLAVYPNPFDTAATIHFDIVQPDTITLKVFDVTGQPVRTFFQSTSLPSGSYNINLLGDNLPNGVYFVRLDIGSTKNITKKVIKTTLTTGITNIQINKGNLVIFPNPTSNNITIPVDGNKTIIITDLNGEILKSFTTDQQIISLLDIATGQYLITIFSNDKIVLKQQVVKI